MFLNSGGSLSPFVGDLLAAGICGTIPCLDGSVMYGTPCRGYLHYAQRLARHLGVR